jgi:hypothetical protein
MPTGANLEAARSKIVLEDPARRLPEIAKSRTGEAAFRIFRNPLDWRYRLVTRSVIRFFNIPGSLLGPATEPDRFSERGIPRQDPQDTGLLFRNVILASSAPSLMSR